MFAIGFFANFEKGRSNRLCLIFFLKIQGHEEVADGCSTVSYRLVGLGILKNPRPYHSNYRGVHAEEAQKTNVFLGRGHFIDLAHYVKAYFFNRIWFNTSFSVKFFSYNDCHILILF